MGLELPSEAKVFIVVSLRKIDFYQFLPTFLIDFLLFYIFLIKINFLL